MPAIRAASSGDVAAIAALMSRRRERYEVHQPVFWRRTADAEARHAAFLATLVSEPSAICRVAEREDRFAGFAIGSLVPSPPVYDPGGPTCTLDDYAVVDDRDWTTIGVDLLRAVTEEARRQGAAQVVVVCGHADEAKRDALRLAGLSIASEWWTTPL
ncbi:GNAT family N-acetyltransferase [Nonomuraea sp. K274]|uniref:GNAT family N-acetyltransferase n=1 Tax=Nonomuraea cypriaca TaxID=1187855 RepID=A0A931A770_9ACTN|nr:GNAT family N-acetyltransferase [Nonomuraea cypriaca]MBF8184630.1 GNAT family N-acetyltransferase [Nonomuraea cypriaca]